MWTHSTQYSFTDNAINYLKYFITISNDAKFLEFHFIHHSSWLAYESITTEKLTLHSRLDKYGIKTKWN